MSSSLILVVVETGFELQYIKIVLNLKHSSIISMCDPISYLRIFKFNLQNIAITVQIRLDTSST